MIERVEKVLEDTGVKMQAVAVTDDPAPGLVGARFAAFGDTAAYTLSPPAVSADGNVLWNA